MAVAALRGEHLGMLELFYTQPLEKSDYAYDEVSCTHTLAAHYARFSHTERHLFCDTTVQAGNTLLHLALKGTPAEPAFPGAPLKSQEAVSKTVQLLLDVGISVYARYQVA